MKMVPCKTCGRERANNGVKCVHCGAAGPQFGIGMMMILIGAIIMFFLMKSTQHMWDPGWERKQERSRQIEEAVREHNKKYGR